MHKTTAVLCTAPSRRDAEQIAARLISTGKAACVNLLAPCRSYYKWEGETRADEEYPLIVKTTAACLDEVVAAIRAAHPFVTPEIIALPIVGGFGDYLAWIEASCADCAS